jgi:hypothetical protein
MTRGICKLVLGVLLGFSAESYGDPARVLILYPQADEPLHHLYIETIKGIESKVKPVDAVELPDDNINLLAELNRRQPDKFIALGKRIADSIKNTPYQNRTIAGWVVLKPPDMAGVSLALEAKTISQQLQQAASFIHKVFVVQEQSRPVIAIPSTESSTTPKMIFREGQDMTATIRLLGNLVETEAIPGEAILIPANLPANILFEIAKIAWNRKIILLSTNLAHLENGILMAFYPDETALGQQLGEMIKQDRLTSDNLKSSKAGINLKVAQHLGITIEPAKLDLFAVKLP